jgi:hypothetical protein
MHPSAGVPTRLTAGDLPGLLIDDSFTFPTVLSSCMGWTIDVHLPTRRGWYLLVAHCSACIKGITAAVHLHNTLHKCAQLHDTNSLYVVCLVTMCTDSLFTNAIPTASPGALGFVPIRSHLPSTGKTKCSNVRHS